MFKKGLFRVYIVIIVFEVSMKVYGYLDIPDELALKIATGENRPITEAVARVANAQIDEYVPFIPSVNESQDAVNATNEVSSSVLNSKGLLIGLGIGAVAIVITGITAGLIIHYKNKKQAILAENQAEFNRCLKQYIEEARNGKLQLKTVDNLISAIDNISLKDKNGAVVLTITVEDFMELLKAVYDYTKKMAAQKSLTIKNFELSTQENSVKEFRHCLELQRKIMLKVA